MNMLECDSEENKEDEASQKLAERIFRSLTSKHSLEDVMKVVKENKDRTVYIVVSRDEPETVSLVADVAGKYSNGEILAIPVPKKFAILEPDRNYFEQTLRANIFLAVMGVDERELHR